MNGSAIIESMKEALAFSDDNRKGVYRVHRFVPSPETKPRDFVPQRAPAAPEK